MERGESNLPLSTIAVFNFPIVNAEMPAVQAYYFLKSEKQPVAAVIDSNAFAGLLHFSHVQSLLKKAR